MKKISQLFWNFVRGRSGKALPYEHGPAAKLRQRQNLLNSGGGCCKSGGCACGTRNG